MDKPSPNDESDSDVADHLLHSDPTTMSAARPPKNSTFSSTSKAEPKTPTPGQRAQRPHTQAVSPGVSGSLLNGSNGIDGDGGSEREAALRAELDALKRMNAAVEGVTQSLDRAKTNMHTISNTVSHATALLDTWTRILAQTEQNQRLILNPAWQGATQDVADAQREAQKREQDKARRQAEETQRRYAAEERKRQQEEEQQRRQAAAASAAAATPTARGRRGVSGSAAVGRGVAGTRGGARGSSLAGASTSSAPGTAVGRAAPGSSAGTSAPRATGRAAVAGYGRIGAVGTKAASRARGRGVG